MKNDIQRLLPYHMRILELALDGHDSVSIAEEVGMSRSGISNILNSPLFQDELARRRLTVQSRLDKDRVDYLNQTREMLNKASVKAAGVLETQLSHDDERIKQGAAKEILDRVFRKDGNNAVASIVMNDVQIQVLMTALKEAKDE